MKVSYRLSVLTLLFLYFILLLLIYILYISPLYSYMGFLAHFSWENTIISLFIIIVFFLLSKLEGVVGFYHQVMMILLLIPSLVLYSVETLSFISFIITISSIFIVYIISSTVKVAAIKMPGLNMNQLLWVMFFISLLTVLSYVIFIGPTGFNLNILKVYEFREAAEDALPSAFGYISPATSKIIVPIMIVLAIIYRRYCFVFSGFIFSILIFGFTAHKSPLFYPFLILGVYLFLGHNRWGGYLYKLLILVLVISAADFYLSEVFTDSFFGIFGSFSLRRAILIPVLLNHYYIDFFSSHDPYYWSESKLTFGLVAKPYDLKMVNLIGEQYFGQSDMAANTGFIGSGYANAKFFGVVLYSVLLGLLISLLNTVSKKIGVRFVVSSSFVVMFTIISSADFITALLTHGLALLLLIYMLIPANGVVNTSRLLEKYDV